MKAHTSVLLVLVILLTSSLPPVRVSTPPVLSKSETTLDVVDKSIQKGKTDPDICYVSFTADIDRDLNPDPTANCSDEYFLPDLRSLSFTIINTNGNLSLDNDFGSGTPACVSGNYR